MAVVSTRQQRQEQEVNERMAALYRTMIDQYAKGNKDAGVKYRLGVMRVQRQFFDVWGDWPNKVSM